MAHEDPKETLDYQAACAHEAPSGTVLEEAGCVQPASSLLFDPNFYQKRKKGKLRLISAPVLEAPVADTHAHLEMLENPAANLARCAVHGVTFVCAMCDPAEDANATFGSLESWREDALRILRESGFGHYAHRVPRLRIAMGVHPHNAKDYTPECRETLLCRLKDPRVCALGEVGLDYHYDFSPREIQREVFRDQVRIAHKTGLPLVLHMREAHEDGLAILREEGFPEAGTLLHCFNLDSAALAPWAEAGCFIAYGGPITFKKAEEVREGAQHVSQNRLLTETDSPYMTPEPMRGSVCGPEHTVFSAAVMAQVRGAQPGSQRAGFLSMVYQNALGLLDREATPWQRG